MNIANWNIFEAMKRLGNTCKNKIDKNRVCMHGF